VVCRQLQPILAMKVLYGLVLKVGDQSLLAEDPNQTTPRDKLPHSSFDLLWKLMPAKSMSFPGLIGCLF